jgi:hypothetical protein
MQVFGPPGQIFRNAGEAGARWRQARADDLTPDAGARASSLRSGLPSGRPAWR